MPVQPGYDTADYGARGGEKPIRYSIVSCPRTKLWSVTICMLTRQPKLHSRLHAIWTSQTHELSAQCSKAANSCCVASPPEMSCRGDCSPKPRPWDGVCSPKCLVAGIVRGEVTHP